MSHEPQRTRPPLFSQIDVSQTAYSAASPARQDVEQTRLLREILSAQDRQNELLEELVSQLGASQKQRSTELGQWKQANPHLARNCRMAAEALGKVQTEFLESLTAEVNANYENLLDGEFMLNEFVDRFGPRMAHLNGLLQVLAQLSAIPNPTGAEHTVAETMKDEVHGYASPRALLRLSFIVSRFLSLFCLLCLMVSGCRPTRDGSPPSESTSTSAIRNPKSEIPNPSAWPVFRGDPQASGVARDGLPEKLELLWTFSAAKGGFDATAAIADGIVYIGCTDGNLYALDLRSGKNRWTLATSSEFRASAAVRNNRVYVGDVDGVFYCLDAATGKKLWDFTTDGEIDSSANFHVGRVLFGSQDGFLYCLDAESGKLVWKHQSGDQIRCFPTVVDHWGFVAGCDGHLHVVDLRQGREVRQVKLDAPTGCAPAVCDAIIFVGTEGSTFFAIDARQGKIVWRYDDPHRGGVFRSSAAVTPSAVIVGSRDKRLHAFDPRTGRPLWTFATQGRVDSSPVAVGDRVFVGSADGRLYELGLKTGRKLWQFEAGGAVVASPAVAAGRLVIGNDAGQLYCFGAKE